MNGNHHKTARAQRTQSRDLPAADQPDQAADELGPFLTERLTLPHRLAGLKTGSRLDRFVIETLLGQGRFGSVFLAEDTVRGEPVALKVVGAGEGAPSLEERLLRREIWIQKKVGDCRHLLPLYDLHEATWRELRLLLLSMEYAGGGTFARWLECRANDLESRRSEGLSHLRQLGRALRAAHEAGIVHGDVKPGNFLLIGDAWKASDFGLACCPEDPAPGREGDELIPAETRGTPAYMSPEQWRGDRLDPRSDIYGLGIILYQTLSPQCRPPFVGSADQIRDCCLHKAVPLWPAMGEWEAAVIVKCLEKDPHSRYQTVQELLDDLAQGASRASGQGGRDGAERMTAASEIWEQAGCAMAENDPHRASQLCQEVLKINPHHEPAIAMLRLLESRREQAEKYHHAIENNLGVTSLCELAEWVQQAAALYPNHPGAHRIISTVAHRSSRYREAMERGAKALKAGNWEVAAAHFQAARELSPGQVELGLLAERLSDYLQYKKQMRQRIDQALLGRQAEEVQLLAAMLDHETEQLRQDVHAQGREYGTRGDEDE